MADPTPKLKALVINTGASAAPLVSVFPFKVSSGAMIVADSSGVYIGGSNVTSVGANGFQVPTTPIALPFGLTSGFTEDIDLSQTYAAGSGTVRILYLDRHLP